MSNPINPNPEGRQFKAVKRSYDIQTDSRAKAQGGKIHPSGRFPLNVKGTGILDRLAVDAGQSVERFNVYYEADDVNDLVAVYIATEVREGVMAARRDADGRTVTLHLGGVFAEYPTMRPVSKRDCEVWRETDAKGRPCMVISLKTALSTRTTTRSDEQ
jgi:hypothetical protein